VPLVFKYDLKLLILQIIEVKVSLFELKDGFWIFDFVVIVFNMGQNGQEVLVAVVKNGTVRFKI